MLKYIVTFLVAMVPVIELRGAIPIGVSWGVPVTQAYIIGVIANMIPVPFIYFYARKILEWGKDKKYVGTFFTFCLQKGESGGRKLMAKAGRGTFLALLIFVGIPIPGTGAWTGTLAASILKIDFKRSVLAVMLGVMMAGVIMALVSGGIFSAVRS